MVNTNYIHKYVILKKTVTKLVTILTKCFSSYRNPSSYLKTKSNTNFDLKLCWKKQSFLFCSLFDESHFQTSVSGGDYMIPASRNEISTPPAHTDFTLQLHVEIKYPPGKTGQFSARYLIRFAYIFLRFFFIQKLSPRRVL